MLAQEGSFEPPELYTWHCPWVKTLLSKSFFRKGHDGIPKTKDSRASISGNSLPSPNHNCFLPWTISFMFCSVWYLLSYLIGSHSTTWNLGISCFVVFELGDSPPFKTCFPPFYRVLLFSPSFHWNAQWRFYVPPVGFY